MRLPHRSGYWAAGAPVFVASELDYAVLIGETFRHAGRDLLRFSDAQLNQGLILLASAACSDYMASLKDTGIPMGIRLATIRSVYDLYRDYFQLRCTETLSHCNRTGRCLPGSGDSWLWGDQSVPSAASRRGP